MNQVYEEIRFICPSADEPNSSAYCAISREDVIKLQNDICAKIMVPTTIIQFKKTRKDEWDRIDSQLACISLRTSCNALRICAQEGEQLCKDNDSAHAEFFKDKSISSIQNGDLDYALKRNFADYEISLPTICGKLTMHPYLKYYCHMLGYIELAFPIFYESKVIGVLIVGQIKTFDNIRLIEKIKREFFAANQDLFIDYIGKIHNDPDISDSDKKEKYRTKAIENYILEKSNRSLNSEYKKKYENEKNMISVDIKDCLNGEDFDDLIIDIQGCLHDFEAELHERTKLERSSLVHKMMDMQIELFAKESSIDHENSFLYIWKCADKVINSIVKQCNLRYISVFGYPSGLGIINDQLKIQAFAGSSSGSLSQKEIEIVTRDFFSQALQDENIYQRSFHDFEKGIPEAYYDHFKKLDNENTKSVLLLPVKQTPNATIVALINYGSVSLKNELKHPILQEMQKFLTLLSSKLVASIEYISQQQYKKTLSMYRHETVHLIDTIRLPLQEYWNPDSRFFKRSQAYSIKYRDIYHDMQRTLKLIGALSAETDFFLHGIELKIEEIPVFKDIIFKWREVYSEIARDKYSTIRIPDVKKRDSRRDYIHSDRELMEIIAYNIIGNAMKYSYKGTNLYIDCARDMDITHPVFSVTDFGNPIPESNEIYDLYYRAASQSGFIPGSGLGLYIVNMAVITAGMSIHHFPKWISSYNVPLLWLSTEKYLDQRAHHPELFAKLFDERERLENIFLDSIPNVRPRRVFEAIISREFMENKIDISWEEIMDTISWPTYQVTFEVVI